MLRKEHVDPAMRLSVIEYLINKLYVAEYLSGGMSLEQIKAAHDAMVAEAGKQAWPTGDAATSDLMAGEWADAFARMLSQQREMAAEALGRAGSRPG
jgi:hypothetical protein